jgi:kumamolisin
MPIPKNYQPLHNSARPTMPKAKRVGRSDPGEIISVTFAVRRRPDAPELPTQEYWANTPPGERKYISSDEFTTKYGAASSDLDLITDFADSHGLKVVEKNAARRTVIVSGKVSNINKAFGVELERYEVEVRQEEPKGKPEMEHPGRKLETKRPKRDREIYRGYEGEVYLPADLVPVVEGVFGLDNRRMARRAITPFPTITPLTPPQVAQLYDFPKPPHHIHKETIGLLEFSDPVIGTCGYLPSDINTYFTTALGIGPGYVTPTLTDIGVNGASNTPGGPDDAEVTLDIEVSGAVAQGAHVAVYFTTWDENGWVLAVKRAVHPNPGEPRPSVLSISWAWTEFFSFGNITWNPATMNAVSTAFQEAAMFGMTVLAASGDNGSNCQIWDGAAHVYYPESDPWVTSCGGTTIGNVAGSSFTEITWNDNGVTGGGISDYFDLPYWQHHHNIPLSINPGSRRGRGVPDISGYANGYQIVLGGVSSGPWWGTSETAPLYAALIAIINAHLGERIGYLNPFFYSHHAAHCFRDINDGRTNAVAPAPGYTCGPGWDACTGLGSIKGKALLKALHREGERHEENGMTGKVAALVFDRFGDFEGFVLEDLHGIEHRFDSHEPEIQHLADRAWAERIVTTVLTRDHHSHRPVSIIFHSYPLRSH